MAAENWLDSILGFFNKAVGFISRLAAGNLSEIASEGWYNKFILWASIIWWVLVFTGVLVAFWHFFLKYKKKVLVKKLKGKAVIDSYMDRAKLHKDSRGKEKLTLLKTRKTMPIPSHAYTQKMGKKDFYEAYLCDDGTLRPKADNVEQIDEIKNVVSVDDKISLQEMAGWRLEEMKLAEEKYKKKGFFDKYKDVFLTFIAMVAAVAIIWISVSKVEGSILSMTKQVAELTKAIVELKGACI